MDFRQFLKRLAIWVVPVVLFWYVLTPVYNVFLTSATNNLYRLTESPNETSVKRYDKHNLLIYRTDIQGRTSTGHVGSIRVTDVQFNWLLTAMLFLAVPGVALRERLRTLGWASLFLACFHLLLLFFFVKFWLATQMGGWSASHFTPFWQNFWGLGKHLLDLPFKFAMPLVLWMACFYAQLRPKSFGQS